MSDQMPPPQADEISLRPYFDAVWRYRRIIGFTMAAVAVLFVVGALFLYLAAPVERLASVQFRLLFDGAEQNRYPNGQPFNVTEIVSPPVVAEVYETNDLKGYGKLEIFQQQLFVTHNNVALQQLDYSYLAQLSDPRLTPVDRARIEEEFLRKREGVRNAEFTLSLRRTERFKSMPDSLMEKVLNDTLAIWAKQADALKGVARPEIDMVSSEVFDRATHEEDSLLVRIDILRSGARRILSALNNMDRIPGARVVRAIGSDGHVSTVASERAIVEDILRFDLEPLKSLTRSSGGADHDRAALIAYVSNQIVDNQLSQRVALQNAQTLQTSLREYMAQRGGRVDAAAAGLSSQGPGQTPSAPVQQPQVAPQFGDAFIDRLLELSAATQSEEIVFRQRLTSRYIESAQNAVQFEREVAYYQDLLKQISSPSMSVRSAGGEEGLTTRFNQTLKALKLSVDRVQKLYDEISVQTLNPARRLYTMTQPFRVAPTGSLVWSRLILFFIFTLAVTLIASIVVALGYVLTRPGGVTPAPAVPSRV